MFRFIANIVVIIAAFIGFGAALVGILAVFGAGFEAIALWLIGYMIVAVFGSLIKFILTD